MRIFIAVNLPKEVKDYLFDLEEEFKGFGKINFIAKKNLHITLKFLGEVKENSLNDIKKKLNNVKLKSFEVSLNNLRIFPNIELIKVLFASLTPKEKLQELFNKVDEELIEYPNNYSFLNHVTLGRIKVLKDKKGFIKKLDLKVKPINFKVTSFELMKSELSKDGSKYSVLETYYLE